MGSPDHPADRTVGLDDDWDTPLPAPPSDQTIETAPSDKALATEPGDQTIATTSSDQTIVANDRTIAGLGVMTPNPSPVVATQALARGTPPAAVEQVPEQVPELQLPEQSPLSFVMRAAEAPAAPSKQTSHDATQFVAALLGDTPPVFANDSPAPMEPVLRRSRKRKHGIVAAALAVAAIAGTAIGMRFASSDEPTRPVASEVVASAEPAAPAPAPAAPQPEQVAPPPSEAPSETVPVANEIATPSQPAERAAPAVAVTKSETRAAVKPKIVKKTTATKTTAAKQTKKPGPKATKTAKTAKKTVAKAAAKKPTAAKKPAAKKPAAKPPAKKTTKKSRS